MEKIIRQLPDDFTIDRDLVLEMIKQTSEELTHTKVSNHDLHYVMIHMSLVIVQNSYIIL